MIAEKLREHCTKKYYSEGNTFTKQHQRIEDLDATCGEARVQFGAWDVTAAIAKLKGGKSGGADGVVPEFLQRVPWVLRAWLGRQFTELSATSMGSTSGFLENLIAGETGQNTGAQNGEGLASDYAQLGATESLHEVF